MTKKLADRYIQKIGAKNNKAHSWIVVDKHSRDDGVVMRHIDEHEARLLCAYMNRLYDKSDARILKSIRNKYRKRKTKKLRHKGS